jgi:ubiquinone/menaquinone biosynthesis C-methylase UbiE
MISFEQHNAARRYALSRPYFHPLVMKRAQKILQLASRVRLALDVACGTGQSTLAALELADYAVGLDNSAEMLAEAHMDDRIRYIHGAAEHIPFRDRRFDLIAVAMAFHWLDRHLFLAEARRLLKIGGWLIIYNSAFTGQMRENPGYESFNRADYLEKFPSPPRNTKVFKEEAALGYGFQFVSRERFEYDIRFDPDELTRYLLTQSNISAVVEGGEQSIRQVYTWILRRVSPYFSAARGTFVFGSAIDILQKMGE